MEIETYKNINTDKKNMANEEVKKQLYVGRIIISLIIASFLFIGVFSFGYFSAFENYKSMVAKQDVIFNSLLEMQIEKELIQSSCDNFDLQSFSDELNNMGSIMGQLEEQLGKNNPDVIEQKKVYTMLQVQHYQLIEENNKNCNAETPILLFFYSNEKDFIDQSEMMGYIISNYRKSNSGTVVYSFDYNLDSKLVNTMKRIKGITQANSVVIGSTILTDLKNIDDLSEAFKKAINTSTNQNTINLN